MKHLSVWNRLGILFIFALVFSPVVLQAQKNRPDIKISKIGCESVKTPTFKSSDETVKNHWGRFYVKFDVKDAGGKNHDWIDTMDITWKVVATDSETKKVRLYTLTVTYEDIEKGSGHNACIFLKPKFMQRFTNSKNFNPGEFSIYVEIRVNGQKVASETELKPKHSGLPSNWYKKDADALRSERYFIPKSKTPFAGLDYDYWENEKSSDVEAEDGDKE